LRRIESKIANPPDPVLLAGQKERVDAMLQELGSAARVVDIGGRSKRWENVWALDLSYHTSLSVVGDATRLPFANGTLDGVICTYVLEHITTPEMAVEEARRTLKTGGTCYLEVPFLFGYHGRDYADYTRWTHRGLEYLC
jgi:SAM-dependent methyltransferase